MAGETWEESRMMIMDKLSNHSGELANIKNELTTFKAEFQIGMTELKTKIMIATAAVNIVVGSLVAFAFKAPH